MMLPSLCLFSTPLSSQRWPSLQRLYEKDLLRPFREVSEDPLLPFELTKRDVEQLGKKLEELSDKEFALISQTGMYLC